MNTKMAMGARSLNGADGRTEFDSCGILYFIYSSLIHVIRLKCVYLNIQFEQNVGYIFNWLNIFNCNAKINRNRTDIHEHILRSICTLYKIEMAFRYNTVRMLILPQYAKYL